MMVIPVKAVHLSLVIMVMKEEMINLVRNQHSFRSMRNLILFGQDRQNSVNLISIKLNNLFLKKKTSSFDNIKVSLRHYKKRAKMG